MQEFLLISELPKRTSPAEEHRRGFILMNKTCLEFLVNS